MEENKMNLNLIHKVSRKDNSLTEEEKIKFRQSKEWLDFRKQIADRQRKQGFHYK